MDAMPRPNWTPGGSNADLEQWMTEQLRLNPSYQLPNGYHVNDQGAVERDQPAWAYRNPWIFPAAGIGAGLLGSTLLPGALPPGTPTPPPAAPGVPGPGNIPGLPGLPGATPAAGNWIADALRIGGPAALTALGRRGSGSGGSGGGGGNQIPIPPELTQLLQEATRRSMNQGPLSDAVTQQALASLPSYAKR